MTFENFHMLPILVITFTIMEKVVLINNIRNKPFYPLSLLYLKIGSYESTISCEKENIVFHKGQIVKLNECCTS